MSSPRRKLDAYYTPARATAELLNHINIRGCGVLECCNGKSDITNILRPETRDVWTNDIDPLLSGLDYYYNVAEETAWVEFTRLGAKFDWVISNPPFSCAPQIVPLAYRYATVGIAMLLRLSYLEPCFRGASDRASWLQVHPPNKLIVLPRISFTGDGKTDNVTCAWFIWEKDINAPRYIKVVPR